MRQLRVANFEAGTRFLGLPQGAGKMLSLALLLLPLSVCGIFDFLPRSYDGTGNNLNFPLWGSTNMPQIRAVAEADYADDVSAAPGIDRPSARAVTTDVFRSTTAVGAHQSALFVAWGLLMVMDIVYNQDDRTKSFDIQCDDGGGFDDVWCPLGQDSDDIAFFRSQASTDSQQNNASPLRNPINYATAYLDLDFLYGRTEEQALSLRTLDGGQMNITERGYPHRNSDGTWKMADQRPGKYPVTFALHAVLLLEHNRCCVDVAPGLGFSGDEDIYQACRGWTIARYQHVIQHDFSIRLLETTVTVGLDADDQYRASSSSSTTTGTNTVSARNLHERPLQSRRRLAEGGLHESPNSVAHEDALEDRSPGYNREGREYEENEHKDGILAAQFTQQRHRQPQLQLQLRSNDVKRKGDFVSYHFSPEETEGDTPVSSGLPLLADDEQRKQNRRGQYRELQQIEVGELGKGSGSKRWGWEGRKLLTADHYDGTVDAGADVFALTVGAVAFEAAIPPFLRIVTENYESADEDMMELAEACKDVGGLIDRNGLNTILRGAVLGSSLRVDSHFPAAVSTASPLFKLPADAVQRGRDHGVPTYNDVREAYGLTPVEAFSYITDDADVVNLLDAAHEGDISLLDAVTGALAEGSNSDSKGILGDLLKEVWLEQLFRTFIGDRHYHHHSRPIENVENTTMRDLIEANVNITDLPLSVFTTPEITVCVANCTEAGSAEISLGDEYLLGWEIRSAEVMAFTLSSKYINDQGMIGIGFGGTAMVDAQDFVVCEVMDGPTAECIDRQPISRRMVPPEDDSNPNLEVESVIIDGDWTSVTFLRYSSKLDHQDYDIRADIDASADTEIIYAYREGEGLGQHPNANRGAFSINFATANVQEVCDENDRYYLLHGCLMLLAWMLFMPLGIYYARYYQGNTIWGRSWLDVHATLMILGAEAVLPMAVTAIFSTNSDHSSEHAKWGIYMIAAVAGQMLSGWLRVEALKGKYSNFSLFHQRTKYFHIWAGRVAFLAGAVQCYRGVELVSSADTLIFSALDIDIEFANFGIVRKYLFPTWLGLLVVAFVFCETRKQKRKFSCKSAANALEETTNCNEDVDSDDCARRDPHVISRKEGLTMYTWDEFNYKVLNGHGWVVVDGTVVDVLNFASRHPGGRRLIINSIGTDVTHEVVSDFDVSVGRVLNRPFTPHNHSEEALSKIADMAVGYIDEEEAHEPRRAVADFDRPKTSQSHYVGVFSNPNVEIAHSGATGVIGEALVGAPAPITSALRRRKTQRVFHVCPLLLRHRMDGGADRAVYKYVFSCPGEAQIMVKAMSGLCHLQMRVVRSSGESMVERSYNAYAVKVQDASPSTTDSASVYSTLNGNIKSVVPVGDAHGESAEGDLCVEIRVRLYHDGVMSKLLERLTNESDSPTVQLQGPFSVHNVSPPPTRRHVIMIAAGTGINPMVQLIRDYQRFDRKNNEKDVELPRLALLWQSTTKEDIYCKQELDALKETGPIPLETTFLTSGDHRKTYSRRSKTSNARERMSLAEVRSTGKVPSEAKELVDTGEDSKPLAPKFDGPIPVFPKLDMASDKAELSGDRKTDSRMDDVESLVGGRSSNTGREKSSNCSVEMPRLTRPSRPAVLAQHMTVMEPPNEAQCQRGKVTRARLESLLGKVVLAMLARLHEQAPAGRETELDLLCGSATNANHGGQLQVIVSGPKGFILNVRNILNELGVPQRALVLLP